jgi:putative hemolysin
LTGTSPAAMADSYFGFRFLLLAFIISLNAFFAAAEVALITARPSRLRRLAEAGQVGSQAALSLLANPGRLLSATQVGVTLASLGLGWAGEDLLYQVIVGVCQPLLTPTSSHFLHILSFTIAFLTISFAHVVLGEVVPKNLAIEKADRLAVLVSPPLLVFTRVVSPFVFAIERSAAAVSRVLGLRPGKHGGGHSAEELKFIISSSRREGLLAGFEENVIQRTLDMEQISVREVMVPRNAMISLAADASLDQALEAFLDHQYSRLPVYEHAPEQIIGILHYKDLLREWMRRRTATRLHLPMRPFRLRVLLRKHLVVPESKPLNQMVDLFREARAHMSMVVDEFGTIVGLITLEDVLEQLFGEIEDEHDLRTPPPAAAPHTLELDGTTPIRDLQMQYGIELPADTGFETLAGFLLFQLGDIPKAGESVNYGGFEFQVLQMDRNRIARVRLVRVEQPSEPVQ